MKDPSKTKEDLLAELAALSEKNLQLEAENARHEETRWQLRNSLSIQKAILDTIPDIVWVKDSDGRFLTMNDAFAKASGRTKEELIGRTDFDFWPIDLARRFLDDDIQVMQSGKKKIIEETLAHSTDEQVWIETIKSPVYSDGGTLIGTLGISRNVTDRKRAHERLTSELAVAARIQRSMLPLKLPSFSEERELDLCAVMLPARQVGGDFYDFFFIDDARLCVFIGDVAGKGVPAALFMAISVALFRSIAREGLSPGNILNRLNTEFARGNDACNFVTAFCGILDVKTGTLSYSNAGHERPYVIAAGDSVGPLAPPNGPALGLLERMTYQDERLILQPADVLFAYTDGVTEAFDHNSELFSAKRLTRQLASLRGESCESIVAGVMEAVASFSKGLDQADDITMMALSLGETNRRQPASLPQSGN